MQDSAEIKQIEKIDNGDDKFGPILISFLERFPKVAEKSLIFSFFMMAQFCAKFQVEMISKKSFIKLMLNFFHSNQIQHVKIYDENIINLKNLESSELYNSFDSCLHRGYSASLTIIYLVSKDADIEKMLSNNLKCLFESNFKELGFLSNTVLLNLFNNVNSELELIREQYFNSELKFHELSKLIYDFDPLLLSHEFVCDSSNACLIRGQFEAALENANFAIMYDSTGSEPYRIKAIVFAVYENYSVALENINMAIENNSDDLYLVHIKRAISYQMRNFSVVPLNAEERYTILMDKIKSFEDNCCSRESEKEERSNRSNLVHGQLQRVLTSEDEKIAALLLAKFSRKRTISQTQFFDSKKEENPNQSNKKQKPNKDQCTINEFKAPHT